MYMQLYPLLSFHYFFFKFPGKPLVRL